jgi:D-alanyl-D-alanine carboxypeptidase
VAVFRFGVKPTSGVSLTCRLDQQPPEACRSPKVYRELAVGGHRFSVTAALGGQRAADGWRWSVLAALPEADPDDLSIFAPEPRVRPSPRRLGATPPPPTISGRCAIAWEAETDAVYYARNPDRACWTGSTAKIMTLHGMLWAIERGYLALKDRYAYSGASVKQGCTCIGNYRRGGLGRGVRPEDVAKVGERTTVQDMLYGIAMSAAQPTVSAGELVAQAAFHDRKTPPSTDEEAHELEIEFVRDVMRPHAAHAGATNANLVNEHGGHESLDESALPGGSKASARDFVHMWAHGIQDSPLFLKILGLTKYVHTNTVPSPPSRTTYEFTKGYSYYPGIEGDKNGSVDPPDDPRWSSIVASAKRLGRRVIVDVMEADGDKETPEDAAVDAGKIFAHAFAKIFTPVRKAFASPKGSVVDEALDCAGARTCVSATVGPTGLRVQAWSVGLDRNSITATGTGSVTGAGLQEVDVAYLGSSGKGKSAVAGTVVTAVRSGTSINLRTWRLQGSGKSPVPSALSASEQGKDIQLLRLGHTRLLTALTLGTNIVRMATWEIGRGGGLTKLKQADGYKAFEVALAPSVLRPDGFVIATQFNSRTNVSAWAVSPSGVITLHGWSQLAARNHPSITRLADGNYALAGADLNGDVTVDYLHIQGPEKSITHLGSMGPYPASVAETRLVPLSLSAVLLAVRDGAQLKLIPMEWDKRFQKKGNHDYFKLGVAKGGSLSGLDMAGLAPNKAAGDVVVASRVAGTLQLGVWRVGAKS